MALVICLTAMTSALAVGGGPPEWHQTSAEGAIELRLRNDEGVSLLLVCHRRGVGVGFEYPVTLGSTTTARIRGIPGGGRNVPVVVLTGRTARVNSADAVDRVLRLLQRSSRLLVRVAGHEATFDVFGSTESVRRCLETVEGKVGGPGGPAWSARRRGF